MIDSSYNEYLYKITPFLITIDKVYGMNRIKKYIFFYVFFRLVNIPIIYNVLESLLRKAIISGRYICKDTSIRMKDGACKVIQDIQVGDEMPNDAIVKAIHQSCDTMYKIIPDYSNLVEDVYYVHHTNVLLVYDKNDGIEKYIVAKDINTDHHVLYRHAFDHMGVSELGIDPYILAFSLSSYYVYDSKIVVEITDKTILEYFNESDMLEMIGLYSFFLNVDDEYELYFNYIEVLEIELHRLSISTLQSLLAGINDSRGNVDIHKNETTMYFKYSDGMFAIVKKICNILNLEYSCFLHQISCVICDSNDPIYFSHYRITINNVNTIPSLKYTYSPLTDPILKPTFSFQMEIVENCDVYSLDVDGNLLLCNYTIFDTTIPTAIEQILLQ